MRLSHCVLLGQSPKTQEWQICSRLDLPNLNFWPFVIRMFCSDLGKLPSVSFWKALGNPKSAM